ncbi:hypothetical protein ACOV11_04780 [Vibrio natriegens]
MALSEKAKKALELFKLKNSQYVTVNEIAEYTGWTQNTVKTYINKKWKGTVLEVPKKGIYIVSIPDDITVEQFDDLQTQVDRRVRT